MPSGDKDWLPAIFLKPKYILMGNLLYVIAVVLVIGWLVGFFGFHAGSIIHVLLVIALIVILLRIIQGKKIV
jgi:hypothetical protein